MIATGGLIHLGGGTSSGSGSSSGIFSINSATGPAIVFTGISGIQVIPSGNTILIAGSFSKYSANFVNLTSGIFSHNLNTLDVIVQVRDTGVIGKRPPAVIMPDEIVFDNSNQISIIFNKSQDGRVVII